MASSSQKPGMEYEVFLSFRGSDTRDSFTSFLYHDMIEKGIRVFRDDEELQVGQKIEDLLQALNNSQIYIPIFSKDFASSAWCLREVARMVDCTSKSDGKKEILPLFFDVKPEDVKLRTELYSSALSKHEEKYGSQEVKRWGDALVEVASRKGWKREGKEYGEFIKSIVREVLVKLMMKNKHLPDHLVKTDDLEHIEKLLDVDANDHVRFVIIHGTGGIGKTTLARIVFNKFRPKFDYSSFLGDVRSHPIVDMQKILLSETLGSNSNQGINDIDDAIERIKRGLGNKQVLVVVDNVDEKEQLKNLAGSCDWFGSGSRIIVTLRDKSIIQNKDNRAQPANYMEYAVQEVPFHLAIQLFSKHAFRSDTPPKDCYEFSKNVVSSIGKLPLTLEVVGSLFAYTDRSKWDDKLEELKHTPHKEVQKTLMISIEKLDPIEKEIFLDIACFCIGKNKTHAECMWSSIDHSSSSAIDVLLLMSLIKINEYDSFWMHDEVRDLGRYIDKVKNFKDGGARRWVRIEEDTLHILRSNQEKRAVQALTLALSHDLTPAEVAGLPMLRFLEGQLNFVGDFSNLLGNLRWLSWYTCPLHFSAMNFHPVNLVVLDLSWSNITHDWGGWMQAKMVENLKVLDLSWCMQLTKTPDFSKFGKLEKLILRSCSNLSTIDQSIGKLKRLRTLDMDECRSLQELPKEIGLLECLSEMILPQLHIPFKLPDTIGNLKSLTTLAIYCDINQVPHSIGRLNLTELNLFYCENLHELPDSIGELESLVKLTLYGLKISILPCSIGGLKNLKRMVLSNCKGLLELSSSIGDLDALIELDLQFSGISVLPNSIGRLKNLKRLLLCKCHNLHKLTDSLGDLKELVELDLSSLRISVLPDSIGRLKNLQRLLLSKCKNLHKLTDSLGDLKELVELDLSSSGISVLPNSIRRLKNLKRLLLSECGDLHKLPDSLGDLKELVELGLSSSGISVLPDSIGRLNNLKRLLLCECKDLHKLPDFMGDLKELVELDLKSSAISVLPDFIGKLKNSTHLSFSGCKNLHELPDSLGDLKELIELNLNSSGISVLPYSIENLKNLQRLNLSFCNNLFELPDSLGDLKELVELDLSSSGISVLPYSIENLRNLRHLDLSFCMNLFDLPDSIGNFESLIMLDLQFSRIFLLPNSIGKLRNLKYLVLFGCNNLLELPESIVDLESSVMFSVLPYSIGRLKNIRCLSFSECGNLLEPTPTSFGAKVISLAKLELEFKTISILPSLVERLTSLTHLSFYGCKSLHELPNTVGNMELLVELDLKSSGITLLPDFIGNLKKLKVLKVADTKIRTIPCALGGVETLEELDASFCPNLMDEIPWELWSLTHLRILNLEGSPISTVPRKISDFSSLHTLKIASHRLSLLPDLPLSLECLMAAVAEFPILPDLSSLVHLHHLEVRKEQLMPFWLRNELTSPWKDGRSVDRLPLSLSTLKLHSIPQLPDFSDFQSLLVLSISVCLTQCLRGLSRLKRLQELRLSDLPELVEVPGLGELESLVFLHISTCNVIKQLPNLSKLKDLRRLELKHCAKLRAVEGLKELKILEIVEMRHCISLEKLPDLSASTKVETNWTPPEPAELSIQLAKRLRL